MCERERERERERQTEGRGLTATMQRGAGEGSGAGQWGKRERENGCVRNLDADQLPRSLGSVRILRQPEEPRHAV